MPSGSIAIANYELMAKLIQTMVDAATAEEWDRLVELERDYALIAERMQIDDLDAVLTEPQRELKRKLIQEILSGDRMVRVQVDSWMKKFRLERDTHRQSQRVKKAYGV